MHGNPTINLIFVNGKMGSGKDTMVKRLVREIPDVSLISTGEIYRGAKAGAGEYAQFQGAIYPFIDLVDNQGGLIPDEVILPIVGDLIARRVHEGFTNFVFNGFPRTVPQLEATDEMATDLRSVFGENKEVVTKFIGLAVTDRVALARVEQRRQSDIRKGRIPRGEDEPEKARARLAVYKAEGKTEDMLHALARQRRLMVIKGSSGQRDEWQRLKRELEHGRPMDRELPRLGRGKET